MEKYFTFRNGNIHGTDNPDTIKKTQFRETVRFNMAEGIGLGEHYSPDKLSNHCFIVALCRTFAHINNGICSNASGKPWEGIWPHLTHLISLLEFAAKQVWRRDTGRDGIFTTSKLSL